MNVPTVLSNTQPSYLWVTAHLPEGRRLASNVIQGPRTVGASHAMAGRLRRWSWLESLGACRTPAPAVTDLDAAIETARAVQRDDGPRAALPLLERALAEARARRSRRHEGLVLGHLGTAHKNLADYGTGDGAARPRRWPSNVSWATRSSRPRRSATSAWSRKRAGNCAKALAVYAQSLEIFTRLDQPRFAASVLNNEALCHDALGQFDRSMANYERALALHRAAGNEVGESESLGNIGGVFLLLGPLSRRDGAVPGVAGDQHAA